MKLRSAHVASAAFIVFGVLVIAFSGDLPFGRLSMPGAGFMPNLVAALLILLAILLALNAGDSPPIEDLGWSDLAHAASVIAITAVAVEFYTRLGFVIVIPVMLLALLVLVEHRNILRAGLYSLVVMVLALGLFEKILRTPLPAGPLGF
jgi:hypothetical protein